MWRHISHWRKSVATANPRPRMNTQNWKRNLGGMWRHEIHRLPVSLKRVSWTGKNKQYFNERNLIATSAILRARKFQKICSVIFNTVIKPSFMFMSIKPVQGKHSKMKHGRLDSDRSKWVYDRRRWIVGRWEPVRFWMYQGKCLVGP